MEVDLAIVGAGTAGAALAAFAARAGMRVACIERRRLDEAGARWVNGVPGWAFDAAGLARPRGDELLAAEHRFHLVAGWGPRRLVLEQHGLLEVDMRRLVERLQALARDAGATFLERTRVLALDDHRLETSGEAVRADFVVDASGLAGARLLEQPRVPPRDVCVAAQEVRVVRDAAAARAFFERHQVVPGDTLCFTAIAGGYSIVNLRLDHDRLGILTGSIPGDGHPPGQALLDDFVREHRWVGERLFGGAGAVPLRRPLDRLCQGHVAALGDAACQVFSAHGSGIAAGLLAARELADTLGRGADLHQYAVAWQRRFGGRFAAIDAFRRFSQTLTPPELERLMASGLLDASSARAGLVQELPAPNAALLASALRASLAERALARRMAPALARTTAALALYARYPEDPTELPRWSSWAARLLH